VKKGVIGLSLTLVVALIATTVLAQGPGYGRRYGAGPAVPNLTTEQSSQIQAFQQAYLKEITPLQQELRIMRTELRSLWLSPNPDQAAVTGKQKEILALQAKIREKATNFRLEMRKVLTPEQQAQFGTFGPGREFVPGLGDRGGLGRWGEPGFPERSPGK